MTIFAYLALVILLVVGWRAGRHQPLIRYFAATFVLFYGVRATILILGLDVAEPPPYFLDPSGGPAFAKALWIISMFVLALMLSYATTEPMSRARLQVFATRPLSLARMHFALVLLSVAAAAVTVVLLARFGSAAGILRAGKVTKQLAGLYIFRSFAAAAALLGAASLVEMRKKRSGGIERLAVGAVTAVNAYFVYLWGTRIVAIIVLAVILLGSGPVEKLRTRRRTRAAPMRPNSEFGRASAGQTRAIRSLIVGFVVVLAAMILRLERASSLNANGDIAFQGANIWRKISLSTNATYMDATILAVQDNHRAFVYPTGRDFVDGIRTLVPGFVWGGKTVDTPGVRFRTIYEPKSVNGWPVGGPTAWYLNFGPIGVLIGGVLSGLILRLLVNAWRTASANGFNTAIALVSFGLVLQLGLNADTVLYAVTWWLPLMFVSAFIQQPRRAHSSGDLPPNATVPTGIGVSR